MTLAPADAAELAEMLQFLSDWLARDQDHLAPSLEGFAASPAYDTRQLRDDLARFIFLPGGSDGEPIRPRAAAEHAAGPARRGRALHQAREALCRRHPPWPSVTGRWPTCRG